MNGTQGGDRLGRPEPIGQPAMAVPVFCPGYREPLTFRDDARRTAVTDGAAPQGRRPRPPSGVSW